MQSARSGLATQNPKNENVPLYNKRPKSFLTKLSTHRPNEKQVWLLILVPALTLNLYHLGTPSLWFDEVLSYERARQSLGIVWQIDFATQPNMALYYLLLHVWIRLTGLFGFLPTEFILRLPSAICAALSSVVLFILGKRFINTTAALVGVSLYLLNTLQLIYAQQTRSYALELLLTCITTYLLLTGFEQAERTEARRNWGRWCWYAVTITAMVYTHLFSVLIIAAHFTLTGLLFCLPTFWRSRVRKSLLPFLFSQMAAFIVSLPLLLAARHAGKTDWLPTPTLSDMRIFAEAFVGGNNKFFLTIMLVILLAFISLLLTAKRSPLNKVAKKFSVVKMFYPAEQTDEGQNRSAHQRWQHKVFTSLRHTSFQTLTPQTMLPMAIVLLCMLVVPFLGSYIISQGSTRLFSTRYLVAIVPQVTLLIGLAVAALPWRSVQLLCAAILLSFATFTVPNYYNTPPVENWKEVTLWLEQHYHSNDGITCFDNADGCQICITYYLENYPTGVTFPEDSPGSFPWVNYDLTNQIDANTEAALDIPTLQNYVATHAHLFFITGRVSTPEQEEDVQHTQDWLDSHYHLEDQISTTGISIRLYNTSLPVHRLSIAQNTADVYL